MRCNCDSRFRNTPDFINWEQSFALRWYPDKSTNLLAATLAGAAVPEHPRPGIVAVDDAAV